MFNNIKKEKICFLFIKLFLICLVKIVNLDTKLNNAVFWSGENGYVISYIYAKRNNKTTIEMKLNQTFIGRLILKLLKEFLHENDQIFWCILSKRFANYANGNINVFISNNNFNSIWYNIELPILLFNSNIKSINIYNI